MNKQQNSPLAKTKPGSSGPEPPGPQASPGPPGPLSQTPPMQRPVEPQEGPHKVSLSTDTRGPHSAQAHRECVCTRSCAQEHTPPARDHRPRKRGPCLFLPLLRLSEPLSMDSWKSEA